MSGVLSTTSGGMQGAGASAASSTKTSRGHMADGNDNSAMSGGSSSGVTANGTAQGSGSFSASTAR